MIQMTRFLSIERNVITQDLFYVLYRQNPLPFLLRRCRKNDLLARTTRESTALYNWPTFLSSWSEVVTDKRHVAVITAMILTVLEGPMTQARSTSRIRSWLVKAALSWEVYFTACFSTTSYRQHMYTYKMRYAGIWKIISP